MDLRDLRHLFQVFVAFTLPRLFICLFLRFLFHVCVASELDDCIPSKNERTLYSLQFHYLWVWFNTIVCILLVNVFRATCWFHFDSFQWIPLSYFVISIPRSCDNPILNTVFLSFRKHVRQKPFSPSLNGVYTGAWQLPNETCAMHRSTSFRVLFVCLCMCFISGETEMTSNKNRPQIMQYECNLRTQMQFTEINRMCKMNEKSPSQRTHYRRSVFQLVKPIWCEKIK